MLYVPVRTEAAAPLSAQIYELTHPAAVRDANDCTTYYCGWCEHPTRTDVVTLELPEEDTIPVHLQSDTVSLQAMLEAFVTTGEITQDEVDAIVATIQQNAGQSISVASLIPPSWQQYVMTYEQAIATGWLRTPEQPS